MCGYLQFRKLLEYKDVLEHCFTLKGLDFWIHKDRDKNQEFDRVINEYKVICDVLGLDYRNIVKPYQFHTDRIKVLDKKVYNDKPDISLEKNTDGVITNKSNIILSTVNADCILLLFFDPVKKVIANIHSGWRGTVQKISEKTVKEMQDKYGSKPEDIIACMTPSIRKCHFEVDEEVKNIFEATFKYTDRLSDIIEKGRVLDGKQKYNIDTILINRIMLEDLGLKDENVIDSKLCSVCESDYIYSYRVMGIENLEETTALIELR